ncbi:hypothetical protein [Neoaquamicrobium sediminum]|uniref:hypothetical protein n=1 Tax=Neoaquamicrobium sediminum TaxID=1849104 RepID=UPI0040356496
MTTPHIPASVRKQLVGFTAEQADLALKSLVLLATVCTDPKVRLDAAKFVSLTHREDEERYFTGSTEAITYIANLPLEDRTSAAMKLFAHGGISRKDLDTLLATIKTDQAARIAELSRDNQLLERENKLLTDQITGKEGPRIDHDATDVPQPSHNGASPKEMAVSYPKPPVETTVTPPVDTPTVDPVDDETA